MKYVIETKNNNADDKQTYRLIVWNNTEIVLLENLREKPELRGTNLTVILVKGDQLDFSLFYGDIVEGI